MKRSIVAFCIVSALALALSSTTAFAQASFADNSNLTARSRLLALVRHFKGEKTVRWIEVGELARRLHGAEAIAVIDVRGPDEFVGPLGHIPNARNVPLAELPHRLQELGSFAAAPVVLICRTDRRSASAAALLEEAGFRDVVVLHGGMVRWNEVGFPVADRSAAPRR
jgi:rhodanese-related sulfurtransferase